MRFSTRKSCAKKVASIGLLVGAAVLTANGIVNHYINNEAQAANYVNGRVYYALRSDYNRTATPDAAMADAAKALSLSSGTAAFCSFGNIDNGYTVTRINPYTGEEAAYWVFTDIIENCENIEETKDGTIINDAENDVVTNDNGATILDENHVFDQTSFYGHYDNQFGSELGSFHLVSFYNTNAKIQAYGNIAVRNLVSNSNNNIAHFEIPTLSYVKNIGTDVRFRSFNNVGSSSEPSAGGIYGDNDSSVLVVGKDAAIGTGDDGNAWTVNGEKVNSPTKRTGSQGQYMNNVWQEYENGPEFLNFDDMKQDAVTLNESIRALSPTIPEENIQHIRGEGDSIDPGIITLVDDNGANVMNLDASDLTPAKNVLVVGFDQHKDASLIINVDVKDATTVDRVKTVTEMMNFMVCYTDESKLDTTKYGNQGDREATTRQGDYYCVNQSWYKDKFPNHIILNYYDSSAPAYSYNAATDAQDEYKINYSKGSTAITVAPRGKVEVTATPYQGIIIANNINMESGDSYFLSMSDNLPVLEPTTCSLVVHHLRYIDANTQTTIRDDDPVVYTCGEIAEVGHAQDLLDAGYIAVDSNGIEPPVVTTTPIGVENNPTEAYLYYKLDDEPDPEVCSIEIHHYIAGTTTPVDEDITMTHYCNNITIDLDISQKALGDGYKFVSGRLESERYVTDYTADDFPMTVKNNFPHKTYILYYDKESPDITENPDVPDTGDKNPVYVLGAVGAIIGFGTATMFFVRRRY